MLIMQLNNKLTLSSRDEEVKYMIFHHSVDEFILLYPIELDKSTNLLKLHKAPYAVMGKPLDDNDESIHR